MRKYYKKQLSDLIDTVIEAHKIWKGYIEGGAVEEAVEMLSECQNAAVRVGEMVEARETEGQQIIALLEEYCEELYQAGIQNLTAQNSDETYRQLNRYMAEIRDQIVESLATQYEVVFLPYKVCMWDSLESIWETAREDDDCSCYVIPIPYINKGQSGNFKEMIYEGDQFPSQVPITHYAEYDLTKRHPDVIYFHNP